MSAFTFDARTVEPDAGRVGTIPAGWYPVVVEKSEQKPTSNGDGMLLNITMNVLDGAYKGSKVFHRFNTKNANPKAEEIGFKQLSALMHAINVLSIQATEQLHNVPLFVRVKVEAATMDNTQTPPVVLYEAKNEVTAFRSTSDQAAKAAFATQQTAGNAAAPAARPAPPLVAAQSASTSNGWPSQAAAPVQASPAAPVQAPAQATVQPWVAPATAQPWVDPAAEAAPVQAPVAPVQPATVAQPAPEQAAVQPSWAAVPAPAEAPPVVQPVVNPEGAAVTSTGEVTPPWL